MADSIILPGDRINLESQDGTTSKTGPGIFRNSVSVPIPVRAGIESVKSLRTGEITYIDSNNKRVSLMLSEFN